MDSGNAESSALFETLLSPAADIPMAVRLVMVRSVTADQMADALKEAVEPRLPKDSDAKVRAAPAPARAGSGAGWLGGR